MVFGDKIMKGFLDGYKKYDIEDGFGDSYKWKSTFHQRMGFKEAESILDREEQTPEQILGINNSSWSFYTFEALNERFRKLIFEHHPDRGGNTKKAQQIIAAFTYLKHKFGK